MTNGHTIKEALEKGSRIELGDKTIVLFDPDTREGLKGLVDTPNIEAFDKKGHKLWTVEIPINKWFYSRMTLKEDGFLEVYSPTGWLFIINPKNGKILRGVLTK